MQAKGGCGLQAHYFKNILTINCVFIRLNQENGPDYTFNHILLHNILLYHLYLKMKALFTKYIEKIYLSYLCGI